MAATRLYVVRESAKVRLIEASNVAQEIRFVALQVFTASVATQQELVELMTAGVKVEKAGEE